MKSFAELVYVLGTNTKTNDKLKALQHYFITAPDDDKVWVIAIFSGRRPKRIVNSTLLQQWCMELTHTPSWLFSECYHTVGDLAETITLLLADKASTQITKSESLSWFLQQFIALQKAEETEKKLFILYWWQHLNSTEIYVFNKLITGGFRIGVSQKMMVNALANTVSIAPSTIAHKLLGNWNPAVISFNDLLHDETSNGDISKPYPFYLSYAVENDVTALGNINEWQAEYKWDGIRGQIIKRQNELFVWSRGEELVTDKFPEYNAFIDKLPNNVVLDGEIICIDTSVTNTIKPLPFAVLQTRIGRKNITKKQLTEAPVAFIAYDVLEYDGVDVREKTLEERHQLLQLIITTAQHQSLLLSPTIVTPTWTHLKQIREKAREIGSEGIMLKRKNSPYLVGRKKGDWWKWKIDAMTIDAVLIYAQKGHVRRSNLYTDYTFAVKDGDVLVPFTKAYSGLTDKEFTEVDQFVKKHAIEKFGPVRTVQPILVFEIAFEGIAESKRHKSGVALRFPRMSRWRKDKKVAEINTLDDLKQILKNYNGSI